MKWARKRDYHGSRRYDLDEPAISQTQLTLAWVIRSAKLRLGTLLDWARRPSSSTTLLSDAERGFSVLGSDESSQRQARAEDCPFPTGSRRIPRANDWRLLP